MSQPALESNRLVLKPIAIDEVETFMEYRNDPKNAKFQSWTPDYTLESASEFIRGVGKAPFPSKGEWNQLAVFLRQQNHNQKQNQNVHIGDIAFKMDSEGTQGELGFTFSRNYQGKGYGTDGEFLKKLVHIKSD